MNKPTRSIEWIVWGGLILVMATVVAAFTVSKLRRPPLPIYGSVPDFALTNQFGRVVSLSDLRGKVWVADIIFTRCPGPCAKMTREMSELQSAIQADAAVQFVSLTADPEFDTPDVLRQYGEKFRASAGRWYFLTGRKPELYRLATKGLMLALDEVKPEERVTDNDLFVHSTKFLVVDKQGRIRAIFDGAEPSSVPKILETVGVLLREGPP
jgi:protein SCO1/2